jgi:hypothetical protein
MSKTMKKKLDVKRINPQNVQQLFEWLGLEVRLNADFRLYGRKGKATIVIPNEVIEALGLRRLSYSDAIGIDIKEDGSVEMVYDHYNEEQAKFIEKYLAGLDGTGGNPKVAEMIAAGFIPQLQINDQDIKLTLNEPEFGSGGGDVWGNNSQPSSEGGSW